MSKIIKSADQDITEEILQNLIGEFIYVPTNIHTFNDNKEEGHNVWFGGRLAGFEKAYIKFDFETGEFYDKPKVIYRLVLTDGMSYVLSPDGDLVIELLSEEEYITKLDVFHTEQAKEQAQIVPDKKIVHPGTAGKEKL